VSGRLLTAEQAAELLNVPAKWPLEQARSGAIPHVKLGRYVRFDEGDLLAWVESLKSGGGPAFRKHRPEVAAERTEG
jgi:excisionase family DNA binding protein